MKYQHAYPRRHKPEGRSGCSGNFWPRVVQTLSVAMAMLLAGTMIALSVTAATVWAAENHCGTRLPRTELSPALSVGYSNESPLAPRCLDAHGGYGSLVVRGRRRRARGNRLQALIVGLLTPVLLMAILIAPLAGWIGQWTHALALPLTPAQVVLRLRRKDKDLADASTIPSAGAASAEIASSAQQRWIEAASKAGVDLSGFDPDATLVQRIAWARSRGLQIGVVLARYSSKMQHSTEAQVEDTVEFAAWHKIYVPPEFICVDEGISGRKQRRDGLLRCKAILEHRLADTLLVFKVSRLFRVAYLGYAFFQEDIVEEGLRAISVSQGVDTAEERSWKKLAYLHGIMDEMLLETIADHVRSGLKSLAQKGYVTGALTVGYEAVEVPGAPLTNRGKPRTVPGIVAGVADLIRQHFAWIRDGMPIKEGWRRWVAAGGPCDRRSKLGYMSYNAYRRMLANGRYTGRIAFGRRRNVWSSKRDYTRQVIQPDTEVVLFQCEELRIVADELFQAVQQRLAELKLGPRGPKKRKNPQLWDLVTDLHYCAACKVRFYQSGANGLGMCCKRGDLCPCKSVVRRKEAVQAECAKLVEQLQRDRDMICQTVQDSQQIDAQGDETLHARADELEKKIAAATRKIDDLTELAGQGTDADRAAMKAKVRLAQSERAAFALELAQVRKALAENSETITPEQAEGILANLSELLTAGANGSLGADMVYRAASVFRRLVGDRIWVHVERRPGRQRTSVRGVFQPTLLRGVQAELGLHTSASNEIPNVEVWLRQPPKRDLLAQRAYQLVDVEGLSYRQAAAVMQEEGHKTVNSGVVWQLRQRYYEMIGQTPPKLPYNNGRRRKPV